MRIIKTADYNEMSKTAANIIAAQMIMKPNCVLGLATGSSPIGPYKVKKLATLERCAARGEEVTALQSARAWRLRECAIYFTS